MACPKKKKKRAHAGPLSRLVDFSANPHDDQRRTPPPPRPLTPLPITTHRSATTRPATSTRKTRLTNTTDDVATDDHSEEFAESPAFPGSRCPSLCALGSWDSPASCSDDSTVLDLSSTFPLPFSLPFSLPLSPSHTSLTRTQWITVATPAHMSFSMTLAVPFAWV